MKKGQAAMEFLMTYGWAILVVIAAIAALAYFGVLDPANLLPERCQFPAGMDCIDKAAVDASDDDVTFALRNNIGADVNITGVSVASGGDCTLSAVTGKAGTSGAIDVDLTANEVSVDNNEVFRIQVTCTEDLQVGNKFEADITVSYLNVDSGLTNQALGNIRGRVAE